MQKLLRPPSLQMTVSERLQLVATPQLVDVRGKIQVRDGSFRFEELPAGSVDLSGDVVIVDYEGSAPGAGQPVPVHLDIEVTIDDRFRIAGSTLNANVGGTLNLVQRPQLPLELFGNLNVLGGELEVYGQRLLVRRGTVSFSGPLESPELNLRAEREIKADNVTVGVSVLGPTSALQLEVYSDPVMPQTEALSYLARGRGLDSGAGGGVDATALALSMGMGAINRSEVVSGLERLPGVSNIEFGTGQLEDDTTATVSGYLGERIYLSYGVGLNAPVSVLTGRLYLRTQLWLEMISSLENSLDIYYSFDID
jgi:autotransporter translocation and assembly factor TamB